MAHPVTWFQISGREHEPLADFYAQVFAWKLSPSPGGPPMSMVAAEERGINGGIAASQDGNPSVTVYVDVDDIAQHLARIEGAGGQVAMPPMELPQGMGWIAGFKDPAGNWVGLYQPSEQARAAAQPAKKPAARKPVAKAAPRAAAKRKPAKKAPKKAPKKKAKRR
jgi:predicted enzyme related to lactoylglutathione lyase